jgi:hypothetical protein
VHENGETKIERDKGMARKRSRERERERERGGKTMR